MLTAYLNKVKTQRVNELKKCHEFIHKQKLMSEGR